jgi:adenylate cyclase
MMLMAAVLAAAVGLRLADPLPVAALRYTVFDSYIAARPRLADPDTPVRIVDIDEASLAEFGQWPWPRSRLAHLIEQLNALGARTISLDLILAEDDRLSPDRLIENYRERTELGELAEQLSRLPANDALLAAQIAKAPVILGFSAETGPARQLTPPRAPLAIAGDDPKIFLPAFSGGVGSLPVLAEAARGIGAVNWLPERDQIVRRVPLLLNVGGAIYPSLALETLRVAAGPSATVLVKSSGASGLTAFGQRTGVEFVRVGEHVMATDGQGELWLHFAATDPRRYISARDVFANRVTRADVEGRHIFIGASATGLMDRRATPLQSSVPGVEIHAQALEQMLQGVHLIRPAWALGAELIFLAGAGGLAAWLISRSGVMLAAAASAGLIALVAAVSWIAFTGTGLLLDPVYPALALVAVYMSGSLSSYLRSERDRARIRSAFGHYVAPAVVDELVRREEPLKLGGETRDVTLLIADVRGFSRLSEGMPAEDLIQFVNALFTPLADTILEHRGTIDKFMGDAVMAFWNAPLPDTDHAVKACRAALAMQERLAAFNAERGAGSEPVRLGIGLNTGACVVGNVGSPQRFDYSVLGDVVNTAARIEEATKEFGAAIIVGEATAQQAAALALVEIGTVSLRGKDRPERLYALMGDEHVASTPEFHAFRFAFAELRERIVRGDKARAQEALLKCRQSGMRGAEPLIAKVQQPITAQTENGSV